MLFRVRPPTPKGSKLARLLPRERQPYTQGGGYLERPFYLSEATLRRQWDADVAKTADAVEGFERLTFHAAGMALRRRCWAMASMPRQPQRKAAGMTSRFS